MASQSTGQSATKLYTPRLLSLSAELAGFPLAGSFERRSEARSRTCGSTVELGADVDASGKVSRIGMQVTACAVGQSSAAIMALALEGKDRDELIKVRRSIEAWLSGKGEMPDWPGFDALGPALPHKGRHGALLLPWIAMTDALSSQSPNG